jgi:hypothetical protein
MVTRMNRCPTMVPTRVSPAKAHADCEVCHHAVQASVPPADGPLMVAGARGYAPPRLSQYLSHISEGPPRPNWLPVA